MRALSENTVFDAGSGEPWTADGGVMTRREDGVCVIRGADALITLQKEWQTLYAKTATPCSVFQSPDWCHAWLTACKDAEPLGVAQFEDGELTAFLPLMATRALGLTKIGVLGGMMAEYIVPLCEPQSVAEFLSDAAETLRKSGAGDVLVLDGLTSDISKGFDRAASVPVEQSHICDLSDHGDYQTYLSSRSSNTRSNVKRSWKRLAKLGEVSVLTGMMTREELAAHYPEMVRWKQEWLHENGIAGAAYDASVNGRVYGALAGSGEDAVSFRIVSIRLDGRPIASNTYLADGRTLHCTGVYRDISVTGISIGTLMQDAAVNYALKNGFERIDFGLGENEDKRRNANMNQARYRLAVALSAPGRIAMELGWLKARDLAKSAFYRLPTPLRQQAMRFRALLGR